MIVLSDEIIAKELTMRTVIELVEHAFIADAHGKVTTFPAIVADIPSINCHFGLKSGHIRFTTHTGASNKDSSRLNSEHVAPENILGLKAGGYWMENLSSHGLPNHRATLLLIDPSNGKALALMSANSITRMRTAAAGAIAARHLAVADACNVTVLGSGEQAHAQIEALRLVREIKRIFVWSRDSASAQRYAALWCELGIHAHAIVSIREALEDTHILVTTTPSRHPLIFNNWIHAGTHINAIGSDGNGKKELDPALVRRAKFVPDSIVQSLSIGELQGVFRHDAEATSQVHAELGQICAGMMAGRQSDTEVTIFDSSGISFQDLVVAGYLVNLAVQKNLGCRITM